MNIEKLNAAVLNDLRNRGHSDAAIAAMSPDEAFHEFCMWNGLINWAETLTSAIDNLRNAAE